MPVKPLNQDFTGISIIHTRFPKYPESGNECCDVFYVNHSDAIDLSSQKNGNEPAGEKDKKCIFRHGNEKPYNFSLS